MGDVAQDQSATTVLIASGTSHIRDSLRTLLCDTSFLTVKGIASTAEQLDCALRDQPPQLLVLDADLPGLSAERLKAVLLKADYSGDLVYMGTCSTNGLAPVVESHGGVVLDRCHGPEEFLEHLRNLTADNV